MRDNIHSYDVARAIEEIYRSPSSGQVYNLGGGRQNACSILEAFDCVEQLTGRKMDFEYDDKPRAGDHVFAISPTSADSKVITHSGKSLSPWTTSSRILSTLGKDGSQLKWDAHEERRFFYRNVGGARTASRQLFARSRSYR